MLVDMTKPCNWKSCAGEAHSNAHIDNCGSCAPFWGVIAVCPACSLVLTLSKTRKTGTCPECRKRFDVTTSFRYPRYEPAQETAMVPVRQCVKPADTFVVGSTVAGIEHTFVAEFVYVSKLDPDVHASCVAILGDISGLDGIWTITWSPTERGPDLDIRTTRIASLYAGRYPNKLDMTDGEDPGADGMAAIESWIRYHE